MVRSGTLMAAGALHTLSLLLAGQAAPHGQTHAAGQLLSGAGLAADAGLVMPWVGLGTGDHSPNPETTCGFHCTLTQHWLELGGRRTDSADS